MECDKESSGTVEEIKSKIGAQLEHTLSTQRGLSKVTIEDDDEEVLDQCMKESLEEDQKKCNTVKAKSGIIKDLLCDALQKCGMDTSSKLASDMCASISRNPEFLNKIAEMVEECEPNLKMSDFMSSFMTKMSEDSEYSKLKKEVLDDMDKVCKEREANDECKAEEKQPVTMLLSSLCGPDSNMSRILGSTFSSLTDLEKKVDEACERSEKPVYSQHDEAIKILCTTLTNLALNAGFGESESKCEAKCKRDADMIEAVNVMESLMKLWGMLSSSKHTAMTPDIPLMTSMILGLCTDNACYSERDRLLRFITRCESLLMSYIKCIQPYNGVCTEKDLVTLEMGIQKNIADIVKCLK